MYSRCIWSCLASLYRFPVDFLRHVRLADPKDELKFANLCEVYDRGSVKNIDEPVIRQPLLSKLRQRPLLKYVVGFSRVESTRSSLVAEPRLPAIRKQKLTVRRLNFCYRNNTRPIRKFALSKQSCRQWRWLITSVSPKRERMRMMR